MGSEPGILDGVRVIDIAIGHAGSMCAQLLAEYGADVVKVEPPEGVTGRGEASFAVRNRSKSSIALDYLGTERETFDGLLGTAAVLVHDLAEEADKHRLSTEHLLQQHPHLIPCSLSSFPAGHELADLPPDDLLVLAASGVLDEHPSTVRDGPAYLRFPLGQWGATWLAATGVVAQLLARKRGGTVAPVATSLFQGALVPTAMLWHDADADQESLEAGNSKTKRPTLFLCADGVWLHLMHHPDDASGMKEAFAAMGADGLRAANEAWGPQRKFPNYGANVEAFKTRPSAEWLPELWAADVPAQAAVVMGEAYTDEQARSCGYAVQVTDSVLGETVQPGPPVHVTPPGKIRKPAPRLDADREDILAKRPAPPGAAATAVTLPLQGLVVLDFGFFLAGPLTSMLLADLGADVIKVEPLKGDPMRINASAFTGCQRNKRSLALDLKHEQSRAVVERLVQRADVVQHNLRMRAATRLGLDYESLRPMNPRIIFSHVSAYGPVGPRKDWPGYDQLFQAQCGWEVAGAGKGNPPIWHRFGMMDHQAAMASLYATLLGLIQREATGEGQAVSASLLGASMQTLSETVLLGDGTLTPVEQLDSEQFGVADNRRLYLCADGLVAVAMDSALPADAPTAAELAQSTIADALDRLTALGVAAVPVMTDQAKAFLTNPAYQANGLVAEYPHPRYGHLRQPGAFWHFHGVAPEFKRGPPERGEHSEEVLAESGFARNEIDALIDCGAIACG
jgi:crotonobetainyl-CoA:carnitine CoA-transferase CaiB-like acyl-CoA transferase